MDRKATLEDLEQLARACLMAGEGWQWGAFRGETIDDVVEELAKTARYGTDTNLWCVWLPDPESEDGSSLIVCHTGNGPTSEAHARFLSIAPKLVLELVAKIREHEATISRLVGRDA